MAAKFSLEKALLRLEEISEKLENENISLDDSLKLFEEGTTLIKKCNEEIKGAEQKITELTE